MSTSILPSLSLLKQRTSDFNVIIESYSSKNLAHNYDIKITYPELQQYLFSHRKTIKAHLRHIVNGSNIGVVALKSIFKVSRKTPELIYWEIQELLKADTLDIAKILKRILFLEIPPSLKFNIFYEYLSYYSHSNKKKDDLLSILKFIIALAEHRKPIISYIHDKLKSHTMDLTRALPLLQVIKLNEFPPYGETFRLLKKGSEEERKLFLRLYNPNLVALQNCISYALEKNDLELLNILCTYAVGIPGFKIGFSLKKIAKDSVYLDEKLVCLSFMINFLRSIDDLFGEHSLISWNQKSLLLLEEEEAGMPQKNFSGNLSKLIRFLENAKTNFYLLKSNLSFLTPLVTRYIFAESLLNYNAPFLDLLWDKMDLNVLAVERLYNSCFVQGYLQSALYLSKKLPHKPTLLFKVLNKLDTIKQKDLKIVYNGSKLTLLQFILTEMKQIVSNDISGCSSLKALADNAKQYSRLIKYLFMLPYVSLPWEAAPYLFNRFAKYVAHTLPACQLIPHFQNLERNSFTTLSDASDHNYQSFLSVRLCFIERRKNTSLLFEIIKSDLSVDLTAQFLAWAFENLPTEAKEEVVNRLEESTGKTIVNYFDVASIDSNEMMKEVFIKISRLLDKSLPNFINKAPIRLIIKFFEIQNNLPFVIKRAYSHRIVSELIMIEEVNLLEKTCEIHTHSLKRLNDWIYYCIRHAKTHSLSLFLKQTLWKNDFKFALLPIRTSSLPILYKLLRYAFALSDYAMQAHVYKRFSEVSDFRDDNGVQNPLLQPLNPKELSRQVEIYPQWIGRSNLLWAIQTNDKSKLKESISSLNLTVSDLQDLIGYLNSRKNSEGLVLSAILKLPSEIRTKHILHKLNLWMKSNSNKKIALKHFKEFLSQGSQLNLFTENPSQYPYLVLSMRNTNLGLYLHKENCNIAPLLRYILCLGDVTLLKTFLGDLSDLKLSSTFEQLAIETWFGAEVVENCEMALTALLEKFISTHYLDYSKKIRIFNLTSLWRYRELVAKIFSLFSIDEIPHAIKAFEKLHKEPILFRITSTNNIELCNAVLPYLTKNDAQFIEATTWENQNIFSTFTALNKNIFKTFIPLLPEHILAKYTKNLPTAHYCHLAAIDVEYVKLSSSSNMLAPLLECVRQNFEDGFRNYLSVWKLSIGQISRLTQEVCHKSPTPKIILSLLLVAAKKNHFKSEIRLVRKLAELGMFSEVIDWIVVKLKTSKRLKYIKRIQKDPTLRKYLWELDDPDLKTYIRSLNMSPEEMRKELTHFAPTMIGIIGSSIPPLEQEHLKMHFLDYFGEFLTLEECLIRAFNDIVVPLEQVKKMPASITNTIEIRDYYDQLDQLFSQITFDDILVTSVTTKGWLAKFYPYLPLSLRKVLVPNLSEIFNTYLKTQTLESQIEFLRYATLAQKKSFLAKIGLTHPSIQKWKAGIEVLKASLTKGIYAEANALFAPHLPLLALKAIILRTLITLKEIFVTSEEASLLTQFHYKKFSKEVKHILKEAKEISQAINALNVDSEPDYFYDFITKERMDDPVVVIDILKNTIVVNSTTVPLLNGINPNGGHTPFELDKVRRHVALREEMRRWDEEHTNNREE